jgi:hypothetical protein
MVLSLILIFGCKEESQRSKLAREPFDKEKCALYSTAVEEAFEKNEKDILETLRNYNSRCFFNTDKLRGLSKQKGMADPF